MNSCDLSLYLRKKKSAEFIKAIIYTRLKAIIDKNTESDDCWDIEIIDSGKQHIVSSLQLVNLLDDYISGKITKFELHFILDAIEVSKDLVIENPEGIKILYYIASPLMDRPIGIQYIKSLIYKP